MRGTPADIYSFFKGSMKDFRYKYLSYTLMQLNITKTYWNQYHGEITRYYSKEHEDLYDSILMYAELDNTFL